MICNRLSWRAAVYELMRLIDRPSRQEPYGVSYRGLRERLRANGSVLREAVGYAWFPFPRASESVLVPFFTRLEGSLGCAASFGSARGSFHSPEGLTR